MVTYITIFVGAFLSSVILTFFVIKFSKKIGLLDLADTERKIHKGSIPLFGGMAIFLSFFIIAFFWRENLLEGNLEMSHWIGVFLGAIVLMFGGFLDDKYGLSPQKQIIFPVLAIFLVISGGVGIEKITNPFGGFLYFDIWNISLFNLWGENYYFTVLSDIFIFIWLLGMMYTTKLLDGMDGLVTGISSIGALIIFIFTITPKYYQGDIAIASLILFGATLGFLIFNWHPAKIFLGEGGSLLLGFLLGVLAIISGGKIAIALLVMGIPILDVVWTILRRLFLGKNPFRFADRKHLHFRIYDLGIGQRKTVLIFYFFSLLFGLSAVFLQSIGKIYALGVLVFLMIMIVLTFRIIENKK